MEQERHVLLSFEGALQTLKADQESLEADEQVRRRWGDAKRVRESLKALYDVNVNYADVAHQQLIKHMERTRVRLLLIGVFGTMLTLLLGLFVHRAIAPRIRRLVRKVHRFRDFGVNEKVVETGKDEIAVLSNALDAGFSAIAAREQERERFLAVAAHELKTPVTSIQGYSSLLINHPEQTTLLPRALEIIHRQSWRLSRLIENLFLAMRARAGQLQFKPQPLDLSELVERSLLEIKPLISNGAFSVRTKPRMPVRVSLDSNDTYATLLIDVQGTDNSVQEIEELFIPFRTVQYESGSGIRTNVGLYLCREIVRVHNGRLRVFEVSSKSPEFLVELPL
jgi:signal transduction histidine kinase